MFRMKKRSYRVFEGLRVATLVSYIGGFIDAYTYNTQDGRFASIQTGNLLYLVIHLVEEIGKDAFRNTVLDKINLKNVKTIGDYAFYNTYIRTLMICHLS